MAKPSKREKKPNKKPPVHIVFVHLDLGIGGAEQLVLQLATASQDLGYKVDLVTSRCDPDHCFDAVGVGGRLHKSLHVYGRWIPPNILGVATALMSTIRMLWITLQTILHFQTADVIVMDVLPTSLPLLCKYLPSAATLFYCHFPDKLLLRDHGGKFKALYRKLLDGLEESTMALSDTLVVNSKFTLQTVQQHFPSLSQHQIGVLYPALDTSKMTQYNQQPKTQQSPIVSLNRFERKKNIGLLIEAYAFLMKQSNSATPLPPLIIAGGYDTQNVENVEYRGELGALASKLDVEVDFRLDISDSERATLFQTALCVVYTPNNEHFGIVPLEAMYAGTPVLAVDSGGPKETVLDRVTGFLRAPTPEAFGKALHDLIRNPQRATEMGVAGREHVSKTFGPERLDREWKELVEATLERGKERRKKEDLPSLVLWMNTGLYVMEIVFVVVAVLFVTAVLRHFGILAPGQSIVGRDEL
ncbi:MAG: hypothetical protein SGARI_004306 [Bacillariaceae sp.]